MNLNPLDIENNVLWQHSQKSFLNLLKILTVNMFLFGVRKSIFTPPYLDGQNYILEALWKQISLYFCIYP